MERHTLLEQALSVYIPTDRRHAMAQASQLPEQASGAAMFADISGFTPLTEALTRALGPRRGSEELTRQLNRVYDALIAEVERFHGSVIGFAGDAITCWFDEAGAIRESPLRAVACALACQRTMEQFAQVAIPGGDTVQLAMKASVASGPARRFLVGDPAIQLIDVLAGATLARMAAGEHLAEKGEVIVDACTAEQIETSDRDREGQIEKRRVCGDREEEGERFFVVEGLASEVEPAPWPELAAGALSEDLVRPWLLPPVYARLREGLGEFVTELRPVVALFLHFEGIDYDEDEDAGAKLDAYLRWTQATLARYEGYLLQFIVGDKGNYLYATF
ncbi:MAG: adenylate/guanylate cyclase domain-containing protein, partial [Thermoflexales bacterium]|nr:adenylate/guanylate cyclase domain-containing protein [Thermoflexales bacterium]